MLPEIGVVADLGNRTCSGPYEGVGIMRSLVLKVAYEGVRRDGSLRFTREHHDRQSLIWTS